MQLSAQFHLRYAGLRRLHNGLRVGADNVEAHSLDLPDLRDAKVTPGQGPDIAEAEFLRKRVLSVMRPGISPSR